MSVGRVQLVGAGPGDPGLLTLRGHQALRRADVVVYDRLVDRRLLALAPRRARRVFAGKACGDHALSQEAINALLVEHALRGRRVVRLKGGDPFVFGRGGEEAEALATRGIPFEVVPGVSAAVAVPAYAGIPVTHRGVASSVTVVTGHEDGGKAAARVDWARLAAGADTLVILMGLRALPRIVAALVAHGRRPGTPVALIQAGTTAGQRTVVGTLSDIVERGQAARLTPPVVIVVGEVVALRERLAWQAPNAVSVTALGRRGMLGGGSQERTRSARRRPSRRVIDGTISASTSTAPSAPTTRPALEMPVSPVGCT
jgi:uroporphyrinogen III methyltransferase / synthase